MAKITRYTGNLLSFGANATGTNRTVFGDTAQSDTLDNNVIADWLTGWEIVSASENPTKQDFNAMGFTLGQLIAYLHQVGVAEWDPAQEYHIDSMTNRNGAIYVSLTDNNINNDPETDTTNWKLIAESNLVDEVIVSGGAVTQIDFTGLDINTHKGYRIEIDSINAVASNIFLRMFVNGDFLTTNYSAQTLTANGAVISANTAASARITENVANELTKAVVSLSLVSGVPFASVRSVHDQGASCFLSVNGWQKTASVANITQLTFTSDIASSLDNGTRIRIYREDA